MTIIDDFSSGSFQSGWYDTNLVTIESHSELGGNAAHFPLDASARLLGDDTLSSGLPSEGSTVEYDVYSEWQYSASHSFDLCATYSGGSIESGYRVYTPESSRNWYFQKFTGGAADFDEDLGAARLDSPSAVVATLHWEYASGGEHTFWWDSDDPDFENPMGTVTASNVDNDYTTGDIGFVNLAAVDWQLGAIRYESAGVPVVGTVALDDETPLENAEVIGINDTQSVVEDTTFTDSAGEYELTMTPGDTAHVLMAYDGEHGTYNAESKPFVVVSE